MKFESPQISLVFVSSLGFIFHQVISVSCFHAMGNDAHSASEKDLDDE